MSKSTKIILITPLNWGLGHVTRCIPIIRLLLKKGVNVILASDGRALLLLKKEFPTLTCLELPAYNVHYRSNNMFVSIAPQLPKIAWAIWKEKRIIQQIIKDYQIDAIISDNRFGCYSSSIPSIFVTHQVNIKIPNRFVERVVAFFNHQFIKRFNACWIPDEAGAQNLGGRLSHGFSLKNTIHVGVLSRMKPIYTPKKYDLIAVLSGPEPQRTYLEKAVIAQLKKRSITGLIVKGKTDEDEETELREGLTLKSYMTSEALNEAICASDIVLARSGYSTLMDLAFLGKKAILVPTPGQTEQEYLAKHFHGQGIFLRQAQKELNIELALHEISYFTGLSVDTELIALQIAIDRLLSQL